VALQFSVSGNLPDVDYLLMLDQIYIASYAGILAVLGVIVASAGRYERADAGGSAAQAGLPAHRGERVALIITGIYAFVLVVILAGNLAARGG
jgi:hypothetical protein